MKKQLYIGIMIGVLSTIAVIYFYPDKKMKSHADKEPSSSENELSHSKENIVSFHDGTFLLYGGKYSFSAGDGDISVVENDIIFSAEGENFISANIVIPRGAVLVAIKEHYTIGFYEGDIKVNNNNKKSSIEKVFFVIYNNDTGVVFYEPNKDKNHSKFLGKKLQGLVTFQ